MAPPCLRASVVSFSSGCSSVPDALPQRLEVEVFAGAGGQVRDAAVGVDAGGGDVVLAAEEADQLGQALHLGGRRRALVEVADQADADAVLVVVVLGAAAVGAVALLDPPRSHLHQP